VGIPSGFPLSYRFDNGINISEAAVCCGSKHIRSVLELAINVPIKIILVLSAGQKHHSVRNARIGSTAAARELTIGMRLYIPQEAHQPH
jgi:hypothetical protein